MKANIIKLKKGIENNFSKKQLIRATTIIDKLKPIYKKIFADHHCKLENIYKVLNMSKDFSELNLKSYRNVYNNNILKYFFDTKDKWLMLNEIIKASAAGELVYKECLSKKLGISAKTLNKYIDEALEGDLFIIMEPYSNIKKDNRIVNIRPSVELTVAYIDYNVSKILDNLTFLENYCKFKDECKLIKSAS